MPVWLDRFPTVQALAQAAPSDVLDAWQGMGYNRRALALHGAAQRVVEDWGGEFPRETHNLVALPGIGPATAQGIRSFAFDLPGVYLETNVRTVFLHHFFPDVPAVPDRELVPLIQAACPAALVRRRMRLRPLPRLKTMPTRRARGITRCWITARILKRRCPIRPGDRRAIAVSPSLRARVAKSARISCVCCWQRAMGSRRGLRLLMPWWALTRWKRQPVAGRSSAT